jgi:hypothetical protein
MKERWSQSEDRWAPIFRRADAFVEAIPFDKPDAIQKVLAGKLQEGQMAFLSQWGEKDGGTKGHATAVVKLQGTLYNINNQGWEQSDRLQTLDEWMTRWQTRSPEHALFGAIVTSLKIPLAAPER